MDDLALVADAVEDDVRQLDPDEPLDLWRILELAREPSGIQRA